MRIFSFGKRFSTKNAKPSAQQPLRLHVSVNNFLLQYHFLCILFSWPTKQTAALRVTISIPPKICIRSLYLCWFIVQSCYHLRCDNTRWITNLTWLSWMFMNAEFDKRKVVPNIIRTGIYTPWSPRKCSSSFFTLGPGRNDTKISNRDLVSQLVPLTQATFYMDHHDPRLK